MKILLIFAIIFIGARAVSFYDLVQEQWKEFKLIHDKHYKDETEEKFRMKIFVENSHMIAKHNQLYEEDLVPYNMKLNKYADMLHYEFVQTLNGFNRSAPNDNRDNAGEKLKGATYIPPANVQLPDTVDWREDGAVTPIKDQGQCGSCWSFSATGALEGQHFRQTGQLVSLSEQNLVDCSYAYGNNGCEGGWMDYAFAYIRDNRGIDTESSYPYEAIDDTCRFNTANTGAEDTGFVDIETGNEDKLKAAVATVGPISVAIDASQFSFQFYQSGVYYEPYCSSDTLDHGVLVVGYGTDPTGGDYWLVKNSWGTSWGDQGYIKMSRNRENNCGIATKASYPLV